MLRQLGFNLQKLLLFYKKINNVVRQGHQSKQGLTKHSSLGAVSA